MKLPVNQAAASRGGDNAAIMPVGAVSPQCSTIKKIACAAALAACAVAPNPLTCILASAPWCADCV